MIDDIVNKSYLCLKSIRKAEELSDFPKSYESLLITAELYLDFLHENSPLLYGVLLPEYLKVRDSKNINRIKLDVGGGW